MSPNSPGMSDASFKKPPAVEKDYRHWNDQRNDNQEAGCPTAGASFSPEKEEPPDLGQRSKAMDFSGTVQETPVAATAIKGTSDVEFDQLVKDCNLNRLRYKCGLCGKDKVKNKGGVDVPHFCPELVKRDRKSVV